MSLGARVPRRRREGRAPRRIRGVRRAAAEPGEGL